MLPRIIVFVILTISQLLSQTSAQNICSKKTDNNGTCCSGDIIISSNITVLEDSAFSNCLGLTSVNFSIANALTEIGENAFLNCSGIVGM